MSSTPVTIKNIVDAWAGIGVPSQNHGDDKRLALDSGEDYAFLHWNRPFPLGVTIASATLRVYTKGSWATTPTLTVKRVDASWKASRINWNNKPGILGGGYTSSHSSAADGDEWAIDITGLMQTISNGAAWYGVRIETTGTARKLLYSADAIDYRPTLDITWSEAPQAPSTLSPSGNRAVSIAKPVLRFDFTDDLGSTALAAVQVQTNATNVWTAPTFDTGSTAATEPELDLAAFETQSGSAVGTVPSTNQVRNPSFETDATLWSGVNSTLARSTVWAATGVASGRVTVTTGGVAAYVYPVGTSGGVYYASVPGEYVSLRYRVKAIRACALRCDVISHNAASTVLGSVSSSVVSLAAGEDATVELVNAPITIATTTKYLPVLRIYENSGLTAPSASATVYVDVDQARTLNHGTTAAPITTLDYRDGTFPNWVWTGTANLSTSSTNVYPGLAAGVSTYWRVRVQDAAGLWSPWSDGSQFRRDNKGTLTITNPAVSPNNFVTEWTPPLAHSLASETQTAFQYQLSVASDPTSIVWDSGRTKSTAVTLTPPPGILEDGSTYRFTVRIWDSKDREATPGDPTYTSTYRDFTVNEDATTAPVTSLTATVVNLKPWMQIGFNRSTAPDYFVVKRDGKVIEDRIVPSDIFVSGTSYLYKDKDASKGRSHTWVVQAVATGKVSASNPSVVGTPSTAGTWLSDNERDIQVLIADTDGSTWAMGESADSWTPLGASAGVRVTQGIRGLEGNVSGQLIEAGGFTADDWADNLSNIRARPRSVCTLHVGKEAFRVVAFNIVVAPVGIAPGTTRGASFDFMQVGKQQFEPRL